MACSFLDRSQPAVPITLLTVSEARRSPGRAGVPHSEVRTDETPPPAQRDATWVFERAGQRIELQHQANDNGSLLTISGAGAPRSYQFKDVTALVRFQSDMEALLLKTGWSFNEFLPDRRSVADRRTWPRLTERRRWWTDGLLRRYFRRRPRKNR